MDETGHNTNSEIDNSEKLSFVAIDSKTKAKLTRNKINEIYVPIQSITSHTIETSETKESNTEEEASAHYIQEEKLSKEFFLNVFKSGFHERSRHTSEDIGRELDYVRFKLDYQVISWHLSESQANVEKHYIFTNFITRLDSVFKNAD